MLGWHHNFSVFFWDGYLRGDRMLRHDYHLISITSRWDEGWIPKGIGRGDDTPQVVDEDEQQADRDQQILQEARFWKTPYSKRPFWAGGQGLSVPNSTINNCLGFSILMFNDVQFHSQGQFGMCIQCIFPSSSHREDFHVNHLTKPGRTSPKSKLWDRKFWAVGQMWKFQHVSMLRFCTLQNGSLGTMTH